MYGKICFHLCGTPDSLERTPEKLLFIRTYSFNNNIHNRKCDKLLREKSLVPSTLYILTYKKITHSRSTNAENAFSNHSGRHKRQQCHQ
ncbi:uncharacterized protein LOC118744662 isoform X3 [Rhagoletis pomonella]|uniref:uncharacterized protein LOC118744662 isoform X3 n=1 Tax=Rhagoletis pomonella TaxID=28610 RepID=UPI001783CE61|nr:uncharacterized protein LOC118744662 isoform X3 [Rhagoletis pomonella]